MKPTPGPDLDAIRSRFPALAADTVFLENAGGSQVPDVVVDAVADYFRTTYVQLGADYPLSRRATETVDAAHALVRTLVGGDAVGEVVLGPSASALCRMLADAYAEVLVAGDEIVVAEAGHEANVGPWLRLARRGVVVRWWRVDPTSGASSLEALDAVLTGRTRIVAFPHVSNLLGDVVDVAAVTRRVHARAPDARCVVDGVAFAPHRAMDVAAWGCDYYVYSTYKVYGPHMGVLFGRHEALAEIPGPNHFFVPADAVPYRFELGGVCHEGCAGLLALGEYLAFLAGRAAFDRETASAAGAAMARLERPLQERLVAWATAHPRARIVGPVHAGDARVPTLSFVHATRPSREIALAANERGFAIRHGHMYAHRLCTAMGIEPEDGVVRVSALHYNTPDEIDRLVATLDEVT